jgi:hypothetical protein
MVESSEFCSCTRSHGKSDKAGIIPGGFFWHLDGLSESFLSSFSAQQKSLSSASEPRPTTHFAWVKFRFTVANVVARAKAPG